MKKSRTSPVGTDDGPGRDLNLDPGIGNARGIREDIGEEPVVEKAIERGIGIRERGTRTGRTEVEPTGRAARVGMEAAEALTVPWRNGWASELHGASPIQHSPNKQARANNSLFMGKSSHQLACVCVQSLPLIADHAFPFSFLRSIPCSCSYKFLSRFFLP